MPAPSQVILNNTEVGPGQVAGPGGQLVFGGVTVPDPVATFVDKGSASPVLDASSQTLVNMCGADVTAPTLPPITSAIDGFSVVVDAGAAMTIAPAGADTIDGAVSYAIGAANTKVVLIARNSTKTWLAFPAA